MPGSDTNYIHIKLNIIELNKEQNNSVKPDKSIITAIIKKGRKSYSQNHILSSAIKTTLHIKNATRRGLENKRGGGWKFHFQLSMHVISDERISPGAALWIRLSQTCNLSKTIQASMNS